MNEKQKRQPFTFWIFSPSFELSAESVTLSVIRNTYLRAHKAAGPPSSTSLRVKLRRVEKLRRDESAWQAQPPLRLFVGDHETFNRLAGDKSINNLRDVRDCDVSVKKVVGFD